MSGTMRSTGRSAAKAALTAAGGMVALAGAVGVAGSALMRQGRAAAAAVESMALQAARADGLVPPDVVIPINQIPVPNADGIFAPDGTGPMDPAGWTGPEPIVLVMMGDSTSLGYGCREASGLPGVLLARGVAAATGRPARLISHGAVGSGAADLDRQATLALADGPAVAVIITGPNDITDKVSPWDSVRMLTETVTRLRERQVPVVLGTCPSLAVIRPIPSPLRQLVGLWSDRLGVMQARATRAAGGRVVLIGRTVSPLFRTDPELFSPDGFHPGEKGYAKAAEALLPEVLAALAD